MPVLGRYGDWVAALARYVLIACLACWPLPHWAQSADADRDHRDHIVERAWLDDPSNSLGPEQVRAMEWIPFSGPLRRGYTASTTWLKLRIDPTVMQAHAGAGRPAQLVLRMMPGHLDEIALFDPRRAGQPPLLAGDTHDWRRAQYRSFNQNLVMDLPSEPMDVFLRLRTSGNHGILVEALRWEDVEAIDRQQQLIFGAVIMFLLTILAWAVTAWWDQRERLIGVFIVQQVASVVFTLSLLGFVRVYLSDGLSPRLIDQIHSATFPMTATAVLWFHWHFLREFRPPALGMRLVKWLALATPLTLLLMWTGHTRLALQTTMVIILLTPPMLLILALLTPKPADSEPPRLTRTHLVVIYSLITLILWNATLPAFGWQPTPIWTMYSAVAYGVVSALILFLALRTRAKYLDALRRQTQLQLALTEQQVLKEQATRREQEQFMTMLTHELTNALATAHLAVGSLDPASPMRGRGYRAIDTMRDIIRRCALSDEIEAADPAPKIAPVNMQALLQELCEQVPDRDSVELKIDQVLPACATDRQLLSVLVGNLLDNALKYRAASSPVELTATVQKQGERAGLQLCVCNVPGQAGRPDPDQVFKKYWRGAGASRFAGSGLGLYLSSLIAQRLGARLQYQPDAANVRFVLWLPI